MEEILIKYQCIVLLLYETFNMKNKRNIKHFCLFEDWVKIP